MTTWQHEYEQLDTLLDLSYAAFGLFQNKGAGSGAKWQADYLQPSIENTTATSLDLK